MSSYVTVAGDTFDSVSRKVYGEESGASRILAANPGAIEPFADGLTLQIPPRADTDGADQDDRTNPDQVSITIVGSRFRFWTSVTITRSLDAVDTFTLSAPFESDRQVFRDAFRPFSYQPVVIAVGGHRLFNGTLVNSTPTIDKNANVVNASGYARPGVLWDCTMPASAYPIEYNGVALDEIARKMVEPFGLSVVFEAPVGAAFEQVSATTEERVGAFLAGLARQRNLVIGSNPDGALVFRQEPTGTPVARLTEGEQPLLSVTPRFSAQKFYSHVTGLEPSIVGIAGGSHTVKNGKVTVVRPFAFTIPDSQEGAVVPAVNAKAARMYGEAVAYTVAVPGIRNANGDLWAPGQRVMLQAPGAMIYEPYEFMIRSVAMTRNQTQATTSLTLMIPGAFSGTLPEVLPWGG